MADAPSPSPYAPGIISDERSPPRPPARAVVYLAATFVMTLATSDDAWGPWALRSLRTTDAETLFLVSLTAAMPVLLWAYLSDARPLLGARRDGYLLIACALVGISWLALAVGEARPEVWWGAAGVFAVAESASRAASVGALTEIGRSRAAVGRFAAASFGLTQLAMLVAPTVLYASAFMLGSAALGVGLAVGLVLAVIVLITTLSSDDLPPVPAPPAGTGTPRFFRSSAFAAVLPLLVCAGLATVPARLVGAQLSAVHRIRISGSAMPWTTHALEVAAAAFYLLACRHLRFGLLLRLALLADAAALAVHALVSRGWDLSLVDPALMVRAIGDGLADIALLDLAMRLAPRGREAFVAILLAGIPKLVASMSAPIIVDMNASLPHAAMFATAAAIAAAIAVSLLPRPIVEARDGRVVGSPS